MKQQNSNSKRKIDRMVTSKNKNKYNNYICSNIVINIFLLFIVQIILGYFYTVTL